MNSKVSVFRKEHFNAAHRLNNAMWDEATNQKVFGKCNNVNYHGHNYEVVVKVTGEVNAETGFVMDIKILSDLIKENVTEKFDHKNLNVDIIELKNVIPTAENIAMVIYNILRPLIKNHLELQIRLYETDRNFVEFPS